MPRPLFIPFKYKLTLIISFILITMLSAAYWAVKNELEKQFTLRIRSELRSSQKMVERLLDESFIRLWNTSNAVSGHVFVKQILTESMDQATRDDLIEEEVFSYYRDIIDIILITDSNGQVLAQTDLAQQIQQVIVATPLFVECVNTGMSAAFFVYHANRYFQIIVYPYFLHDEMIGVLSVGLEVSRADLQRIKDMSSVDLAFIDSDGIFLTTNWHPNHETHAALTREFDVSSTNVARDNKESSNGRRDARDVVLGSERFLYFMNRLRFDLFEQANTELDTQQQIIPTYSDGNSQSVDTSFISIKSLDKELIFLNDLLHKIFLTGLAGITVATIAAFLFSLKISGPIKSLQLATRKVDDGDYSFQIAIQSNDEFRHLGESFNDMIHGLAEKERVRSVMEKVVSREIATEMLKGECQLGGEERYATILFSDIRGFTSLAEGLSPTELLKLLNKYFTHMSQCIDRHRGVIDKYIGDAIMALFGVPLCDDACALHAVHAAQDMQKALQLFNNEFGIEKRNAIGIGIGINSGNLVAGNMGAENRMNYTVLGDQVNLASRLEGLCKQYGVSIIISESTFSAIKDTKADGEHLPIMRELDTVQVKGKSEGIKIFQVFQYDVKFDGLAEKLEHFGEGLTLLRNEKIAESLRLFRDLSESWPTDNPTKVYLERCQRYMDAADEYRKDYSNGVYLASSK